MKWRRLALIVLFSSSVSAETIKFCSLDRPFLSQEDGTGYYWDLIKAVYRVEDITINHSTAPFARCLYQVEKKLVDAGVAVFKTPEREKKFTYPKSRVHFSSYGLISLRGTEFDGFEKVKGKIGVIRGYDFSAWLPSNLPCHSITSNVQAINMLKSKRIDYHADDIQDVLFSLQTMGEKPEQFHFYKLHTQNLYIIFTKDRRGKDLADKFDIGLRKIYQDGMLQQLTKKYDLTDSILHDFK